MRVSNNNNYTKGQSFYNIGMTSITEQDWEELMDNIDICLDKAREMKDSELPQKENESLESKIYNKLYPTLHKNN